LIEPIAYLKKLEGKSNAHLITFNDGRDYVVKYLQPGFEKTLPNEWVSYCLARFLNLPIPFAHLVEIPSDFSSQVPELEQMSNNKIQFASLYLPECYNGHQISSINQITNHEILAGIILFDYWLSNKDRTRKNILLKEVDETTYHLSIIDHAEIFGSYNWQLSDIENLPEELTKSATHQLMAVYINDEKYLKNQLDVIQKIPALLLEEIVELIPDDWNVSIEEKKGIVSTLLKRRKKVLPLLMNKFIKNVYRPLHNKKTD